MALIVQVDDLLGKPFKIGGRGPDGYDCWGLAMEVFRRAGVMVPDYWDIKTYFPKAIEGLIRRFEVEWQKIPQEVAPCAVVVRTHPRFCNHIGVYVGDGLFIHCLRSTGVILSRLRDRFWRERIEGFYVYRA